MHHSDYGWGIQRGDRVSTPCCDCGTQYKYTEGVADDPPRNTSFCPDCYPDERRAASALVAGTWTVRDEAFRAQMIDAIRERTEYDVYVAERVNQLYVYDPAEVADE